MSMRKVFSTIFGLTVLATTVALANAQVTEQTAREQASNVVRSELHSRLSFKSDQFLQVQRDEELEQSLAVAVAMSTPSSSVFIYRASETGYEISAKGVRYHFIMDGDYSYIVAVRPADGIVYRIHGFGLKESEPVREVDERNKHQGVEFGPSRSRRGLLSQGESRQFHASSNFKLNRSETDRRAPVSNEFLRRGRTKVRRLVEGCEAPICGYSV